MNLCLECKSDTKSDKKIYCSDKCRKRYARKSDKADNLVADNPEVEISTRAKLLPVDVSQPFSHQRIEALSIHPKAVHNTRKGKDEWVVPGSCKWGDCLNPKCQFHNEPFGCSHYEVKDGICISCGEIR